MISLYAHLNPCPFYHIFSSLTSFGQGSDKAALLVPSASQGQPTTTSRFSPNATGVSFVGDMFHQCHWWRANILSNTAYFRWVFQGPEFLNFLLVLAKTKMLLFYGKKHHDRKKQTNEKKNKSKLLNAILYSLQHYRTTLLLLLQKSWN